MDPSRAIALEVGVGGEGPCLSLPCLSQPQGTSEAALEFQGAPFETAVFQDCWTYAEGNSVSEPYLSALSKPGL